MRKHRLLLLAFFLTSMVSCFWNNKKTEVADVVNKERTDKSVKNQGLSMSPSAGIKADKSLVIFARYFEKADAVHREAWWVLNAERKPISKSPFGKVQRALLAAQNVKLSNKSLFRCDKYVVKRDILKVEGFPQNVEIFEKCSEKIGAKKIAEFVAKSKYDISVTFFPENLEEILGLGATILNTPINCDLRGNEKDQLVVLDCKNWFQERTKEQAIKLDTFNYQMEGQNIIKLRGKVYVNLTESRKIESDVPMTGKIFVKETEMYPQEEEKDPVIKSTMQVIDSSAPPAHFQLNESGPQTYSIPQNSSGITPIIINSNKAGDGTGNSVDPDILIQQRQQRMKTQQLQSAPEVEQLEQELQEQQQQENLSPAEDQQTDQSMSQPENHQESGEIYGR